VLGLGLAVLAFETDQAARLELVHECAAGAAAGVALWVLVSSLARDREEGFCLAADHTRGGRTARLVGRTFGATLGSAVAAGVVALLGLALGGADTGDGLYLLSTSSCSALLAAAWGLLLGVAGLGPAAGLLTGAGLWVTAHLPWGAPGWDLGGVGRVIGAVLPGVPQGAAGAAAAVLAAVGVGGLALLGAMGEKRGVGVIRRAAPGFGQHSASS
jgi:hypothetical protein